MTRASFSELLRYPSVKNYSVQCDNYDDDNDESSLKIIVPSKEKLERQKSVNNQRLAIVLFSLFLWLVCAMTAAYCIVEYVIIDRKHPRPDETIYSRMRQQQHGNIPDQPGTWGATDTAPGIAQLDDEEWKVFLGFVIWVTVMISGLGMELLIYVVILLNHGWTAQEDRFWMLAQFFFPLFAIMYLGLAVSQNYMALVFLVLGLWKLGFPETIFYQHLALYGEGPLFKAVSNPGHFSLPESHLYRHLSHHGQNRSTVGRMSDFMNGTGTVLHHGAASFVVSMFLAGVITPDRHALSCCLILVMQHWFSLLQPASLVAYIVVEIFLEICFEWIIFSDFEYIANNHWTASMATAAMLFAHWQYFISGTFDLVAQYLHEQQEARGGRERGGLPNTKKRQPTRDILDATMPGEEEPLDIETPTSSVRFDIGESSRTILTGDPTTWSGRSAALYQDNDEDYRDTESAMMRPVEETKAPNKDRKMRSTSVGATTISSSTTTVEEPEVDEEEATLLLVASTDDVDGGDEDATFTTTAEQQTKRPLKTGKKTKKGAKNKKTTSRSSDPPGTRVIAPSAPIALLEGASNVVNFTMIQPRSTSISQNNKNKKQGQK